jgi:hypothetical protein
MPKADESLFFNFKGYSSPQICRLEDFFALVKKDSMNYNYYEGMHCGKICCKGEIHYIFDEQSQPHISTRQLFKKESLDDDDREMCMFQSALLDSARAISSFATDDGFYFAPRWFDDVMNECDIGKFHQESLLTGEDLDDILRKNYPEMYKIKHKLGHHDNVEAWTVGFLHAVEDCGLLQQLTQGDSAEPYLSMIASLRDNRYYSQISTRPCTLNSTLKLIDFFMFAYFVPLDVSKLYSVIRLEGKYQLSPSSKKADSQISCKRHREKCRHYGRGR